MLSQLKRFFGMYAPTEKLRIAMYRSFGSQIGTPRTFGSHIFLDGLGKVIIEDDVIIAGFDRILSHSCDVNGAREQWKGKPTRICKGAIIGVNVTILGGVTIGENALIGADSLVTKDIPANCTAYGRPCKAQEFF